MTATHLSSTFNRHNATAHTTTTLEHLASTCLRKLDDYEAEQDRIEVLKGYLRQASLHACPAYANADAPRTGEHEQLPELMYG